VTGSAKPTREIAWEPCSPTMQLLRLALPIIGMMVSRMLMGFIDFVMVSQLGTEAQAAISPATIFVFALGCLGMGVANSVQTFVSQADGRGEPRQAGAYAWQSLYIAAIFGLLTWPVVTTTSTWFGWVAHLAHHKPAVAAMEVQYIEIALWSVPLAVLSMGLNAFFMGIQRPRVALLAVILSLVVNASGNYLLIFGKLGFPEMGIAGAAVATVIGWAVRVAFLVGAILLPEFDRRYNTRRSLAWSAPKLAGMLRIGGPTAIQWLLDIGSWVVFMAMIMPPYGTDAMAASNVAMQYMHLSFMPAIGIGVALCSQVGFAIGEGDPERAVRRTRVAMRLTGLYMGAIGLLFVLARQPLMELLSDDPAVIGVGTWVLIGAAVFQVFDAMGITYMNALRGAGDTRWPAVVVALCCWVIFIGGGLAVGQLLPLLGLMGPWIMCAVYIIVLGLLLRWRWRAGPWREIRLFDHTPAQVADEDAGAAETRSPGPSAAVDPD
jgi:MATE family multidrug resistance protein